MAGSARDDRRAAALRANLHRRKAQSRGRVGGAAETKGTPQAVTDRGAAASGTQQDTRPSDQGVADAK